jgi:hypothetical protein
VLKAGVIPKFWEQYIYSYQTIGVGMTGCIFIEQAVKPSATWLLVLPKIVLFDKNPLLIHFFVDNYFIITILVLPKQGPHNEKRRITNGTGGF